MMNLSSFSKWAALKIISCLQKSFKFWLYSSYLGFASLGQHQGNNARAGAHVQNLLSILYTCPRTKQNAIGTYPMDVFILNDFKLFELKDVDDCKL